MPKSKRRKTPNRKPVPPSAYGKRKSYPTLTKLVVTPDGRQEHRTFEIKPLRTDVERCLGGAVNSTPDFAIALIPAALTMDWMRTHPANVCAQACLHLADVYRLLGLDASIVPVTVAVAEGRNLALYGQEHPRWDDEVYCGHCLVNLPSERRIVDPTIQQFDGFQHREYPYIGRVVADSTGLQRCAPGDHMTVMVDNRQITYTVAEAGEDLITEHPVAQRARKVNERAPANLAGQTIDAFRLLDIAEHIPDRYARIHAMLAAVGDAPLITELGKARFALDDGEPQWIDEIMPT